ncbi:MAG: BACON domain-containing protein [Bacteroidales bacterium]|nr:BACON domain-containing protein [Bacteroidales bacterium]MBQ9710911.1 BACON domain-containing protein [Bacteroidales bacterium]
MRKSLLFSAIALMALLLTGCQKNKDILLLSNEKVTLSNEVGRYTITSNSGFYLDEIKQDGKTISLRTEHADGTLLLDGGWIVVRTPEARSKELAHGMLITVSANTGDSSRDCQIIVHNGSKVKKVSVHQKSSSED